MRLRGWLTSFVLLGLASAGGVAVRLLHYPDAIPRWLAKSLEWVSNPGVAIWWLTLGGPFQDYPRSTMGYVIVVLASLLFWLLVVAAILLVVKAIRRAVDSTHL